MGKEKEGRRGAVGNILYNLVPRLAPAQGKGESLGTMLTFLPKGFSEEEVEEWRHVEGR